MMLTRPTADLLEFYYRISDLHGLKVRGENGDIRSLSDAARWVGYAGCQNPADKVYGLISLIDPREVEMIPVNLRQSTAEVFARATFASIITQKNFGILELVRLDTGVVHDLPSWTADFTSICSLDDHPSDGELRHRSFGIKWPHPDNHDNECASISEDARYLTLSGFKYSRFEEVLDMPSQRWTVSGGTERSRRNAVEFGTKLSSFIVERLPCDHAGFSKTEAQSQLQDVMTPDVVLTNGDQTLLVSFLTAALIVIKDIIFPDIRKKAKPFWECSQNEKLERRVTTDGLRRLHEYADYSSGSSRVFVTSDGSIGLAPATVRAGDRIAFIRDCAHPFIVRPMGQYYSFRGFGWIDGLRGSVDVRSIVGSVVLEEPFVLV